MNPMQFMMNQMGNMGNMVKGQTNAKGMPVFTAPGKHEAKQQINPMLFKQYIPMVNRCKRQFTFVPRAQRRKTL